MQSSSLRSTARARRMVALLVAGFALAACSADTVPTVPNNLSEDEVESVAEFATAQTHDVLNTMLFDLPGDEAGARAATLGMRSAGVATSSLGDCAVVSGDQTDGDTDGIPKDALYTYFAAQCYEEHPEYGFGVELEGPLRAQDTNEGKQGFDATLKLGTSSADFAVKLIALDEAQKPTGEWFSVRQAGTRAVTGSAAGLTQTTDLITKIAASNGDAGQTGRKTTATFTPATGQAIDPELPLPEGALTLSGTVRVTEGTKSLDLSVQTVSPLQYSPDCVDSGTGNFFTAGELRLQVTKGGKGTVKVVYADCEEPQVTYQP